MCQAGCYDYAVVGRGLIGAATALHLRTLAPQATMVAIGPTETTPGAHVPAGSHHDQGRITRVLDADVFWSTVAAHSMAHYRTLEQDTKIEFFRECGCLMVNSDHSVIHKVADLARSLGQETTLLPYDELLAHYPYLNFDATTLGIVQKKGAGVVNPRGYLQALEAKGWMVGVEQVEGVVQGLRWEEGERVWVVTGTHRDEELTIKARKVVVATGAYAALDKLVMCPLPLTVRLTNVVLVPAGDAHDLQNMPSVIHRPPISMGRPGTYMLPPVEYPQGGMWLKIGGVGERPTAKTVQELDEWFKHGQNPQLQEALVGELKRTIPSLDVSSTKFIPCATTHTSDTRPIIDCIGPGSTLGLAVAGNGYAAKSADALGELAARRVLGLECEWLPVEWRELSLERFKP